MHITPRAKISHTFNRQKPSKKMAILQSCDYIAILNNKRKRIKGARKMKDSKDFTVNAQEEDNKQKFLQDDFFFPITSKEERVEIENKANTGDAEAQFDLGDYYFIGDSNAFNKRDVKKAVHWYIKAAEQGHLRAQCRLGKNYLEGRIPHDLMSEEQAVNWLTNAAEKGHAESQNVLGYLYYFT